MFSKLMATAALILVAAVGSANAGVGPTPQGLKADGLRYQAMARFYESRPAASYYSARALKAEGLRWQAMGRLYAAPKVASASSSTFSWSDAGLGAAGGIALLVCGGVVIVFARRSRRAKLAL